MSKTINNNLNNGEYKYNSKLNTSNNSHTSISEGSTGSGGVFNINDIHNVLNVSIKKNFDFNKMSSCYASSNNIFYVNNTSAKFDGFVLKQKAVSIANCINSTSIVNGITNDICNNTNYCNTNNKDSNTNTNTNTNTNINKSK
jgi:hypothetical protein